MEMCPRTRRPRPAGFTLLEMLVALGCFGVLIGLLSSVMTAFTRGNTRALNRVTGDAELTEIIQTIEKVFRSRYIPGPPGPPAAPPVALFCLPIGVLPCAYPQSWANTALAAGGYGADPPAAGVPGTFLKFPFPPTPGVSETTAWTGIASDGGPKGLGPCTDLLVRRHHPVTDFANSNTVYTGVEEIYFTTSCQIGAPGLPIGSSLFTNAAGNAGDNNCLTFGRVPMQFNIRSYLTFRTTSFNGAKFFAAPPPSPGGPDPIFHQTTYPKNGAIKNTGVCFRYQPPPTLSAGNLGTILVEIRSQAFSGQDYQKGSYTQSFAKTVLPIAAQQVEYLPAVSSP